MEKQNQSRLIEILNYLLENTDKNHYVTIVDLQKYLSFKNMKPDRKTLAKDLETLNGIGWINITCERNIQNRYYISKRIFDESEVKMLCDAVRSSYFISDKSSKELITTLKNFVGPTGKKNIDTPSFIDASVRTKNNEVIKNANKISKAITSEKQITFKYFDYDSEGKKNYKHDGKKYIVSPYAMVIRDGKYYIAAYEQEDEKIKTFRIDKMDIVSISSFDAFPIPKEFNAKKFEEQTAMFEGYESNVELLCDTDILYNLFDKFGNAIRIEKVDMSHFKVSVTTNVSPTFFGWIVGFGGKIKVIGPDKVLENYRNTLLDCLNIDS